MAAAPLVRLSARLERSRWIDLGIAVFVAAVATKPPRRGDDRRAGAVVCAAFRAALQRAGLRPGVPDLRGAGGVVYAGRLRAAARGGGRAGLRDGLLRDRRGAIWGDPPHQQHLPFL